MQPFHKVKDTFLERALSGAGEILVAWRMGWPTLAKGKAPANRRMKIKASVDDLEELLDREERLPIGGEAHHLSRLQQVAEHLQSESFEHHAERAEAAQSIPAGSQGTLRQMFLHAGELCSGRTVERDHFLPGHLGHHRFPLVCAKIA